ncbi:MAG: HPr kinase/phosphatase C-terminal domain-containing protein [Alphaproteobacteria bacterium]|nr:HPr kinase/phosphatase C-terminal domain-containing protein [Alphaproteobacteria bacterium]
MTETIHASAVSWNGRGMLIRGASGSGKSALALELMAFGADLIGDDRIILSRRADHVVASCPAALRGMIEARGFGILRAKPASPAPLVCIVDLDQAAEGRLPHLQSLTLLGCNLPLIQRPIGVSFAPALLQYLRAGRIA